MAAASTILSDLPRHLGEAVRFYWQTRTKQLEKQAGSGAKDQVQRFAQSLVARAAAFTGRIKEL